MKQIVVNKAQLSVLLIVIAFSGCATTQSLDVSKRTRVFTADYLSTFKAAVDYCNEQGFAITMADKELGLLNTDYKENDGTAKFFLGNARAKINLSFSKVSESETKVISTISGEKQGAFGSWTQATMSSSEAANYYQKVFDGIQSHLSK